MERRTRRLLRNRRHPQSLTPPRNEPTKSRRLSSLVTHRRQQLRRMGPTQRPNRMLRGVRTPRKVPVLRLRKPVRPRRRPSSVREELPSRAFSWRAAIRLRKNVTPPIRCWDRRKRILRKLLNSSSVQHRRIPSPRFVSSWISRKPRWPTGMWNAAAHSPGRLNCFPKIWSSRKSNLAHSDRYLPLARALFTLASKS